MFGDITRKTLNNERLGSAAIGYYKSMASKVYPKILVDQTHPNIWHVEQLLRAFPQSKFIAISRNVHSVVYSMREHRGVSGWLKDHQKYPRPNEFLGITPDNQAVYENSLSSLQRAVFRWCSHEDRIKELAEKYSDSVLTVRYESLAERMEDVMSRIADFVGVRAPSELEDFGRESLDKKDKLTTTETNEIELALDLYARH